MRLNFNIEKDEATPAVARLRAAAADRLGQNRAAAEGMLPGVRRSLREMAATNHNPFGAPSTFWMLMLAGTSAGADANGGYVSTPRPVALRYFGGTVVPKTTSYLAIPARTEAYGKSPKDFTDLRFVLFAGRGGLAALVQTPLADGAKTRGKGVDDKGRKSIAPREQGDMVFYWLVRSATINANPEVLPTREENTAAAVKGVATYFRLARRGEAQ